jgi:hypothetical protein
VKVIVYADFSCVYCYLATKTRRKGPSGLRASPPGHNGRMDLGLRDRAYLVTAGSRGRRSVRHPARGELLDDGRAESAQVVR